jgi:hypothetical protein
MTAAMGDDADTGTDAVAARGSRPDGARQPLRIAVVGAQPDAVRRLSCELERRIKSATGLTVHRGNRPDGPDAAAASSAEVVIFETLPAPRTPTSHRGIGLRSQENPESLDVFQTPSGSGLGAARPWGRTRTSIVDLVLLCRDGGGNSSSSSSSSSSSAVDTVQATKSPQDGPRSVVAGGSEDHWRERLIGMGVDWCAVGGPASDPVEQAMDALAPWLRARSRPGAGLFSRLAERNAQEAARPWRCADCDDPDCEHALRSTRPGGYSKLPG